ncbi:MAG: universal stress protein [Deltaproteobacteria bacterium]|nr:universal stress protein [Deltaproteobacteria bacterium]
MLFRHVVLAVDFSEPSAVAARTLFRLAERTQTSKITVVHVTEPVVLPSPREVVLRARLEALQTQIIEKASKRARDFCDQMAAREVGRDPAGRSRFPHEEVQLEIVTVAGRPAEVVPEVAGRVGASLVAMGTHSRKGVRRLFFGSIVEAAVARISCPALVLHVGGDGVAPDVELEELQSIVVGVELGPGAEAVVDAAAELSSALRPDARIVLVHATDSSRRLEDTELRLELESAVEEAASSELAELRARLPNPERVECRVIHGSADDAVLDVAAETSAEIIVIGERKGAHAVLGSTGVQILRHSNVSVLIVPVPS